MINLTSPELKLDETIKLVDERKSEEERSPVPKVDTLQVTERSHSALQEFSKELRKDDQGGIINFKQLTPLGLNKEPP